MATACQRGCHGDWAPSAQHIASPSLSNSLSLPSFFFLLLVISSHTSGRLFPITVLVRPNENFNAGYRASRTSSLMTSDTRSLLQSYREHMLEQSTAGPGITPSRISGFVCQTTIIGGSREQIAPRRLSHPDKRNDLVLWRTGTVACCMTQKCHTAFSPAALHADIICLWVNCHCELCDSQTMQNPTKTS